MFLFPLRIPGALSACLGAFGYLSLVFTPGAWVTFGLSLDGLPFWARLFTGATLSPLIVCAEFYAIRFVGIPFGMTAHILVLLNLPAIYFIWKRRPRVVSLDHIDALIGAVTVVIPVVCMMSLLVTIDARIYSPHAWIYSDPIYMLARGSLILEDPTLAGIKLTYPVWGGLVFEAVHSSLVNSPPQSCFVWTNLLWLIFNYGLAVGITKEMGGGKLAQISSGIWLLLGTNPVGYTLMHLAPGGMQHQFWGDPRYTPWVSKFQVFSTMEAGLGMILAMIYLLVRPRRLTRQVLLIAGFLLCGIGLFYPLLFPAACGIIGAKAFSLLAEKQNSRWTFPSRDWLALACSIALAALVTYGQLRFLTSDKPVLSGPILLSGADSVARKIFESLIATSLLIVGLAFTFRRCWEFRRSAMVFLLGGALMNYILHAAFHILYTDNEYKFIFVVSMCLFVFPALATERVWQEWPRAKSLPLLAAVALFVLTAYVHWSYANWPTPVARQWNQKWAPLDLTTFYLKLAPGQEWSGICDAVDRMTPVDTVLVLTSSRFYFPGLTKRSLYISPVGWGVYPGVNLDADLLDGEMRGNGREILRERHATLAELFGTSDPVRRQEALDKILALERPVAIIAEPQHSDLLAWLKHRTGADELYVENGLSLWLFYSTRYSER